MLKSVQFVLMRPFNFYNNALDRNPLTTKCLTSGTMYAGITITLLLIRTLNYTICPSISQQASQ